jgi:hypothetical protein
MDAARKLRTCHCLAGAPPPDRQPSPQVAAAASPAPSPALQLNPLFDQGARAGPGAQPTFSHQPVSADAESPANWPPQQAAQAAATPAQQQRTPAGFGFGRGAELGGINITPLSGMAPGRVPAAPTPGNITPVQQQGLQQRGFQPAATPPLASPAALEQQPPASSEATPVSHQAAAEAGAAAFSFAITPLSTMAARPAVHAGLAAPGTEAATPPSTTDAQPATAAAGMPALNITPLSSMRPGRVSGQPADQAAGAVLQESTNQPHRALQQQLSNLRQQERQILQRPPTQAPHRRSPTHSASGGSPRAASPTTRQPAAPQAQAQQAAQFPALAENQHSPQGLAGSQKGQVPAPVGLVGIKQQQQQQQQGEAVVAVVVEDSAVLPYSAKLARKEALAAQQQREDAAAATAQEGGAGEQWFVKAAMGGRQEEAEDVAMLDAPTTAAAAPAAPAASESSLPQQRSLSRCSSLSSVPNSPSSPGFSFQAAATTAVQQQHHGGSGGTQQQGTPGARLGQRSRGASPLPGPTAPMAAGHAAVAPAQAYPGVPHGLREDILALHLDVLNQFQVSQPGDPDSCSIHLVQDLGIVLPGRL